MGQDYEKKTVAQLHDLLKARSLPTSGRKNDLIARLQEADNEAKAANGGAKADTGDDVIDWDDEAPAAAAAAAEAVQTSTKAGAAAIAAGGKGEVPNPVAVPNQELAVDPAKTDDLKVESVGDAPAKVAEAEAAAKNEKAEETPAVDYTMGLQATELEAELKKRKARAEKFGIVEDTETALAEAEKTLQRAKRFGTGDAPSGPAVSRLDQALPTERPPHKRGRGDEQGAQGGKRRNFAGGRNRAGRPNNRIRNGGDGNSKLALSEKDAAAAEARKKRFATAA
jgi:SAP domain-containing ribonucleoprotein